MTSAKYRFMLVQQRINYLKIPGWSDLSIFDGNIIGKFDFQNLSIQIFKKLNLGEDTLCDAVTFYFVRTVAVEVLRSIGLH